MKRFSLSRQFWVLLHRWAGLFMALFLVVAGLTGSFIAFYKDIDRWVNPHLLVVTPQGERLSPLVLREMVEKRIPEAQLTSVPLFGEAADSVTFYASPRINPATSRPYELGFDNIHVNPYTGEELGRRIMGAFALTREQLPTFIFKFHYTLALPNPWGTWLMGAVALLWFFDCFVGFYLTLPVRRKAFFQKWKPAWLIKRGASAARLNFDLHRAVSLWTWQVLLILAISSVQLNLSREVFRPVLNALLPFAHPGKNVPRLARPVENPPLGWQAGLERGRALMAQRAARESFTVFDERYIFYNASRGAYSYSVNSSNDIANQTGLTTLYFSAIDGRDLGLLHPYSASGNAVSQWLYALHMATIWGLPYRIFVALMGVAIAMLSVTGVLIWLRKRNARRAQSAQADQGKPISDTESDAFVYRPSTTPLIS